MDGLSYSRLRWSHSPTPKLILRANRWRTHTKAMKKNPKLEAIRKKLYSGNSYRCSHCGFITTRKDLNGKKWFKAYCYKSGKDVHMMLVKPKKKWKSMPTKQSYGFCKAVQRYMSPVRVSKALISMVKSGERNNDAVKEAIQIVQVNWQKQWLTLATGK